MQSRALAIVVVLAGVVGLAWLVVDAAQRQPEAQEGGAGSEAAERRPEPSLASAHAAPRARQATSAGTAARAPEAASPRPGRGERARAGAAEGAPHSEAIERYEALVAAGDAQGLLALFRESGTVLRFGALRAHLELVGPGGLPALVAVLAEDPDPRVHAVLQEAFGAGGDAALAGRLAEALPELAAPSARLAAGGAILDIATRTPLDAPALARAAGALAAVAREAPGSAEAVMDALGRGPGEAAHRALARAAGDPAVPEAARLLACERLLERGDRAAEAHLERLSAEAASSHVRDLAAIYLSRLRAGR